MSSPDHVRPRGAAPAPGAWPAGWAVWHVAETGSTNADLHDAADRLPDRTVLVADHQTAGRGRLDRRWETPAGVNLLVSILFRDVPADAGELTRRVGLAAVDAVGAWGIEGAALKWPNDLLLDGRKLAGILAQRAPNGSVVVGLGLNVGWAPDGAARLVGVATTVEPSTVDVTPQEVLREILAAYDRLPTDITDRYRDALTTIGLRVRVELPDGELLGTAIDVEPDGRLVVLDDCAISHRLDVGDVVHVRAA